MSLLDALLLDQYPFDVWIAYRTDGIKGSGTASDPWDGSTAAHFDAIMASLPSNVCIHLGACPRDAQNSVIPFKTSGYVDGVSGGWLSVAAMPGGGMEGIMVSREAAFIGIIDFLLPNRRPPRRLGGVMCGKISVHPDDGACFHGRRRLP